MRRAYFTSDCAGCWWRCDVGKLMRGGFFFFQKRYRFRRPSFIQILLLLIGTFASKEFFRVRTDHLPSINDEPIQFTLIDSNSWIYRAFACIKTLRRLAVGSENYAAYVASSGSKNWQDPEELSRFMFGTKKHLVADFLKICIQSAGWNCMALERDFLPPKWSVLAGALKFIVPSLFSMCSKISICGVLQSR